MTVKLYKDFPEEYELNIKDNSEAGVYDCIVIRKESVSGNLSRKMVDAKYERCHG